MHSIIAARPSARLRRALAIGAALATLSAPSIGAAQDLSLSGALSRVASGDPVAAASAARVQAAEAAIAQADVRPRDVVSVDIEDFGGTGPYSPINRSHTTAWYERTWERAALAAYWGRAIHFRLSPAAFDSPHTTERRTENNPDLALLAAERDAADARLRLAETGNVGNPTGRVGVHHFGDGNEVALVVGGSILLGSRSADRGNVLRAQSDAKAAEAGIAVARVQVARKIDRLVAERAAILTEIARLDREVLPNAERAVVLVRDGFRRGGTAASAPVERTLRISLRPRSARNEP